MLQRKHALGLSAMYFTLGVIGFLLILVYINEVANKQENPLYLLVDGAVLLVFSIFLLDVLRNYRRLYLKKKAPAL